MTESANDHEPKLRDYARTVAVYAELLETYGRHIRTVTSEERRDTWKTVIASLDRVQALGRNRLG
jgi:hypothetical protein